MIDQCTRRHAVQRSVQLLGAAAAAWSLADKADAAELPLKNTGLEHYGMTVHDPEAAAKFYGRIFDPQLFQERDPPPRYYVRLGKSYLAFGGNQNIPSPSIDHFCVLTDGYGQGEARKLMEAAGVTFGGNGPLGMATDPDGLRLQLLAVPGGLARTIIPSSRISQDDALVQAIGTDHIVLHVSDLEKSTAHYRKIFGPEKKRGKRVWFTVAKTRLGLEAAAAGEKPSIHHICLRIAGFDKRGITEKLKAAGVDVIPSDDENLLRFRDPNGLVMELA